jgi:glycosyltransferase involved in cell wall biosynthesis
MTYFNLYAPLNELGYGALARGLIRGLSEIGIREFHLNPIGGIDVENPAEKQDLTQRASTYLWNRSYPGVAVCKLVAFPVFETTEMLPQAKYYLSQMDAILVMSKWAKEVTMQNIGNKVPIFVVPGAANLVTTPDVTSVPRGPTFTFLTIGKFEQRKSHVEAMQAYLNAFSGSNKDTRMICHVYNPFDQQFRNNMLGLFQHLGIRPINATNTQSLVGVKGSCIIEIPLGRLPTEQVSKLYRHCHVGVFPAKAEGWNLPLMEAIQSNLPCIATNYSAHTEYVGSEYGYPQDLLLNKFQMGVAQDNVYFHGNRGLWAVPSVDEISEKMLYCFNNYEEVSRNFDPAKIKEVFTWKNTATKFIEALDTLK